VPGGLDVSALLVAGAVLLVAAAGVEVPAGADETGVFRGTGVAHPASASPATAASATALCLMVPPFRR
jgi:hypothetical protein